MIDEGTFEIYFEKIGGFLKTTIPKLFDGPFQIFFLENKIPKNDDSIRISECLCDSFMCMAEIDIFISVLVIGFMTEGFNVKSHYAT